MIINIYLRKKNFKLKNTYSLFFKKLIIENKYFVGITLFIFIAIFALQNYNERFWLYDFKVYYLAAKSLVEGTPIYGVAFGLNTGFYKYSPFTLILFTPALLFNFSTATVIQYFVISFVTIASFLLIQNIISKYIFDTTLLNKNLIMILAFIGVFRHLFREVHMGNVNMIIVLLLNLGLLFTLKSKYILSGICIGIVVLIKPYFLLLMLPLLIYGKLKTIVSTGLTVVVAVIIPFLIFGFSQGLSLHQNWLNSMLAHSSYLFSYETIFSLLKMYLFENIPNVFQVIIIAMVIILFLFVFLNLKNKAKSNEKKELLNNSNFIVGFLILLAIIPNLLITDTEHFLFATPLVLYIINYLFINKNKVENAVFVFIILLYAAFTTDVLGNVFTNKIDSMGMLGLSNLFIIGFSIYIIIKNKKQQQ